MVTSGGLVSGKGAIQIHQPFEVVVTLELIDGGHHCLQVAAPRRRQERREKLGSDMYANIDKFAGSCQDIIREGVLSAAGGGAE